MSDLNEHVASQLSTIKQLENFISLYLRKDKLLPDLREMDAITTEVQDLISKCNNFQEEYQKYIIDSFKELRDTLRLQQLTLLNILDEISKRGSLHMLDPGEKQVARSCLKNQENTPVNHGRTLKVAETPRMYISDYEQSPFISKFKPVSLQFIDFEAEIPLESFEAIPKYMRGRTTLEELKQYLETIIIPCLTDKYQLLHRKREFLRSQIDVDLWRKYRTEESLYPGVRFITQDDLVRKNGKQIDKKSAAKISMLRHLGILQEDHKKSLTCYLWRG